MESAASQTFPCPECGKKLKWKPAIAGKVGKCGCGAKVKAPATLGDADDISLLYDLAGPPTQPVEVVAPPPLPRKAEIAYASRGAQVSADAASVDSTELLHEVFLPLAVLLGGFLAVIAWFSTHHHGHFGAISFAVTSIISCVLLVIKTIALSLLIWMIASQSGGSLGNPLTLVLKIASLLIFLDAAEMWITDLLKATGAITAAGKGPIGVIGCSLAVSFMLAFGVSKFVYGLEGNAARVFGRVVAIGNWAMNWLAVLLVGILVHSLTHAAARAQAVAGPAPANHPMAIIAPGMVVSISSAPVTPPSAVSVATDPDHVIQFRINRGSPAIIEGREWQHSMLAVDRIKPVLGMISHMYDAGAVKVYVDNVATKPREMGPGAMYVELPADKDQRAACLAVARGYESQNGLDPVASSAGKFLAVSLK